MPVQDWKAFHHIGEGQAFRHAFVNKIQISFKGARNTQMVDDNSIKYLSSFINQRRFSNSALSIDKDSSFFLNIFSLNFYSDLYRYNLSQHRCQVPERIFREKLFFAHSFGFAI